MLVVEAWTRPHQLPLCGPLTPLVAPVDDVQGAAALGPAQLVLLVLEAEIAQRRGEADPADIVGGERAQDLGGNARTRTAPESEPLYSTRACSRWARAGGALS